MLTLLWLILLFISLNVFLIFNLTKISNQKCFLFARYGAYSAKEVYHPSHVSELLLYAYQRGVQVILELDGPAHAGYGWQWGPELNLGDLAICINQQPWRDYCGQPPCGQLNPSNPNLFKVMKDLFKDIIDIFPHGSVLHMGGDEVSTILRYF